MLRGAVPPDPHRELRAAVQRVFDGDDEGIRHRQTRTRGGTTSTQLQQVHRASATVRDFLHGSGLAGAAADLMATDEVRLWHDQVIYKDAHRGGRVDRHQDYYYWPHLDRPTSVTAWTALTEATPDNGCVWVVPGSHLRGVLDSHGPDGIPFAQDPADPVGSPRVPAEAGTATVPLQLLPGDLSFHHCLTLHGSGENRTAGPRHGYTTHFLPRGVRYRKALDTVREHEVGVADGEEITGEGFPPLHRAADGAAGPS